MKSFMCSMPSPVLAETSRTGQPSGSSGPRLLEVFLGGEVYLVQDDDRVAVDSAARQSVYDVIVCDVGAQRHGGGDYAEAAHDALYLLLRQVGLLERRSDHYPTPPRPRDEYLRWLLIEPHPRLPELVVENLEVSTLERVDDIQHHIATANHIENLATSTLTLGSTLDETR